jgi:survival-of-motor-neuron-related-splicing factor 30
MDQVLEYETQLADVEALLQATPDDPSLVSLKSDLVELLAITKESISTEASESAVSESAKLSEAPADEDADADFPDTWNHPNDNIPADVSSTASASASASDALKRPDGPIDAEATAEQPVKKKARKIKDFEVPEHLVPLDTDTDAEKNRKRRAIKTLKNKHRERKKEVESDKKQKSWQSFQKKKVKTKDSMFSTQDGDAKVGVVSVSGRQLTEFGERKRHQS